MRRYAELGETPITEDDAFIAHALESASIPTLMMSMLHITGDPSILRGEIRPHACIMSEYQGSMSEEEQATVRAQALEILKGYRDGGCRLPPPPSPELIHEMMSFLVAEPVPGEYVPMMLEEIDLEASDTRDIHWPKEDAAERKQAFPVIVIGAGMSGLLAAIRLEEAGVPYTVIEKNAGVGGTWYENRYPGCRVDIGNHFYCYSFEPNHDWPEYFAQHDELRAYFERCSEKYGVAPHIRFETEVTSARWDDSSARWQVEIESKGGGRETLSACAVISAVGQLNRPMIPDIPGREQFAGESFHSARWRQDVDVAGKRVAVIGTGASAFQLVPAVAKEAALLSVFQRSPVWMFPNPRYHEEVNEGKKWLLEHVPFYARWFRFLIFWPGSDGLLPSLRIDPDWPHPERSVNALNEATRNSFTAYMKAQIADDPELLEKVIPEYPPFGKRILQDNGSWLGALGRENVELVCESIERITPEGVVTNDGRLHAADVIVYATGFQANEFLFPMEIVGRGGVKLADQWGEDPKAYLGITVPRFPNLFCLYGPATNLAHAGSIIFHSECQVRYVMGCIRAIIERQARSIECRQQVHDAYDERLQETLAGMVWSHPGMTSWYKNSQGRVTTTSPWRLLDYWAWTKEPDLADFELR